MKEIWLAIVLTLIFSLRANAQSADECFENPGCVQSLAVDSGNTSKMCNDNEAWRCTCASMSCHDSVVATTCPTGYTNFGDTVTGKHCCHDLSRSCAEKSKHEVQHLSNNDGLSQVFDSDRGTDIFFGLVNQISYSPSAGRANNTEAKLDACFGSSSGSLFDTLQYTYSADPYGAYSGCMGSGYCQNTGSFCLENSSAVCADRCACRYQQELIDLGYSDPGCNGL